MHITQDELDKFQNDSMNTEEMIAFLEHMDYCDYCLEQILNFEKSSDIQAPAYMKDQILTKAATPTVQAGKTVSSASYRMQLFYCGLKTAAGVLMALILLFGITEMDFASITPDHTIQTEIPERPSLSENRSNHLYHFSQEVNRGLTEGSQTLTEYLNEFSNKIINGGK
ncbi:MAG: hypothetical protein Q4C77_16055 [Eubacteriales bacterium]|nr:hypothetical protein [Eubacteriales bacterium]